jgi:arsenate reductase
MNKIVIYGIPNCDTIKKARHFLDTNHIEYSFHDYKKLGVSQELLQAWGKVLGYEKLINRRSTTWRKLSEELKHSLDEKAALELMQSQPSIIKRPILDAGDRILCGFNQSEYETLL